MKLKKIVITGALGQDGILLSKILCKKNYLVYGIINKNFKNKKNNIKYSRINLLNYSKLSHFLDKIKPSCLVHLGDKNPSFLETKKNFYSDNLKITKNLIDYFSKKKLESKLILIGSSQMYGNKKKITINSGFKPENYYAKFRLKSYNYMLKKKKMHKLNMVMAILFNHDSVFRNSKFLLPRLVNDLNKKNFDKINTIYQENISGDFSHAEDICIGLYKLIISKENPDKLIFSSNKKTYINDIIKFLLKKYIFKKKFFLLKKKNKITPIGDNTFTKKLLNWNIKKNIFIAANELKKIKS